MILREGVTISIKKVNEFFGYTLCIVGISKIVLIILVLLKVSSNLVSIFNGEYIETDSYQMISTIIGSAQLILAVSSIVMIIINIKKQPEVITGYLWGLGALSIEFITPPIMLIFVIFAECGIYIKAGCKIRDKSLGYDRKNKTTKKMVQNTEWFYADKNEQDNKNKQNEINIQNESKRQKKIAKLEEEICEWKKLLDSGQIDEETYKKETDKLILKKSNRERIF